MDDRVARRTAEPADADSPEAVYGVHTVRANEVAVTTLVCRSLASAQEYAAGVSTDPGVLAAAVTHYPLDTPGERSPVALFVAGIRQDVPYISDDRRVYANGRDQRT